jgi:glycosyltransferase involved in cell wall biosynthesis
MQSMLESRLSRRADVSLAVSADLVDRIQSMGGRDVRLMPVGAAPLPQPVRHPDEVRAELDAGDRAVIVSLGRLHAQKGFDVLIEAARTWTDSRQLQPLLVIAGDGPDRMLLAEKAQSRAVDVRWLGYLEDRRVIAELLAVADVVVVPSRWEGSPLAVHEALQLGRPVVATAVGGLPALLGEDEVMFVPPEDPVALAAAVAAVLDDPERAVALGAAGQRAAARWPDADTAARAVLEVYAELLAT